MPANVQPNQSANGHATDPAAALAGRAVAPPKSLAAPLVPLLLRAAQAAVYCGVSEATWWRWDASGKVPRGRKVSGGVKVWSRPELEAWAATGLPDRATWEALQAAKGRQPR